MKLNDPPPDYVTQEEFMSLRKRVNRLSLACSLLAVVLCGTFTVGFMRAASQTVPDVITTKKLVLIDGAGKTTAILGPSVDGFQRPTVELKLDANARSQVTLTSGQEFVSLNALAKNSLNNPGSSASLIVASDHTNFELFSDVSKPNAPILRHLYLSTGPDMTLVKACGNTQSGTINCPKLQQ